MQCKHMFFKAYGSILTNAELIGIACVTYAKLTHSKLKNFATIMRHQISDIQQKLFKTLEQQSLQILKGLTLDKC